MGFAKAFVLMQLSLLLVSTSTVFSEGVDILTDALPPNPHGGSHYPATAPSHPPSHHHHHHHTHSPSHPPVPPPSPPYHHGHPPTHEPVPVPHPPSPPYYHGHPPTREPIPVPHPPPHAPSHAPVHPPMHPPIPRSFVAVQGVVYCKSCKYAGVDTLLGASPVLDATVKLECYNTKYPLVVQAKTDKNGYFFITAPKTITNYGAHKCKVYLVTSPLASCSKPSDLHYGLQGAILRPEKPYMSDKLPFVLYTVGPFAFEPKC